MKISSAEIHHGAANQLLRIISRYTRACILALLLTVLPRAPTQAGILDQWYWRNPTPFANSLRSICFGAGKFVAVGDGGVIHTSFDGANWDDGRRPVASMWRKVIFANGLFVTVGHEGAVATSSDGYLWTKRSSGTTNILFSIAYENGHYVVCGEAGQVTISTNGLNWTAGTVGTNDLKWIAAGNGVFILPMPNQQMAVRVSSDLQTWTTATFPNSASILYPHYLFEAHFGNGLFLAAVQDEVLAGGWQPSPHFYRSTDGTNWVQGAGGGGGVSTYRFLDCANGFFHEFYTTGPGGPGEALIHSSNGTDYSFSLLPTDMSDASSLVYGNGRYVMPGISGKVWTSNSATNWNSTYSGLRTSFYQLLRAESNYVLIAAGQRILLSSDGYSFAAATNSPAGVLSSAAFDGSNYVAVGKIAQGGLLNYVGEVYTSTNSTDWARRTSNAGKPLTSICRGTTRWAAVGENGTVVTSPNALAWTLRASGTANKLNGVAFGNNLYVAVGNTGTVITSPDGAAWDVQFSGTTANLNRVRFLNGQFVAVGAGGNILTSLDGATWFNPTSGTTRTLTDVAFGDGRYVVCGSDFMILNTDDPMLYQHYLTTTFNVLLQSTNAVNWEDATTRVPVQVGLNSIAFLNDSFWLSGESGALLQSDSLSGIPRLAGVVLPNNSGFQIKLTINVPASYRLQASTNMAADSWGDIAVGTNSTRQTVFVDGNTAGFTEKFYRLASP